MTNGFANTLRLAALAALVAACAKSDAPKADTAAAAGAPATATASSNSTAAPDSAAMASSSTAPTTGSGTMLDPNGATKEQLTAVPGMTPAAADALIKGRPYADMTAADKALAGAGLDATARKQVYAQVWKPIDLNKTTDAEILLIPGVGAKMNHEFHEYRPWTSAAQFDREIGKYVDKTELARLRKYVALQ
jgi:DNA uptake protein ComE-like DNA-binding protein